MASCHAHVQDRPYRYIPEIWGILNETPCNESAALVTVARFQDSSPGRQDSLEHVTTFGVSFPLTQNADRAAP